MPAIEELLQPIDALEPSGKNLRYDTLFDSIRQARSEDDASLPQGDWNRPAKRADYALVGALVADALRKRSKDLWLAAWLGEASLHRESHAALAPALRFLLHLQQEFWPTLFPEIEEGDLSLRAAPLQWSLDRYAALLYELPITEEGTSYATYKAVRSGKVGDQDEEAHGSQNLDASIAATDVSFYAGLDQALTLALGELEALHVFCDERYSEEGPSFIRLRSALDEIQNVTTQLLRVKGAQDPKPNLVVAEAPPQPAPASSGIASPESTLSNSFSEPQPVPPESPLSFSEAFSSRQDALRQMGACLRYLLQEEPVNAAAYLLALALQHGQEAGQASAPSSETRLALKRAGEDGEWPALLQGAIRAMADAGGKRWLDLQRYTWQAAAALEAAPLQAMVLAQTRALLHENAGSDEDAFEDDTPVANGETQRWIAAEVQPPAPSSQSAAPPILAAPLPVAELSDLLAEARLLARDGNIPEAARMLMEDLSAARSGRGNFMRRLDVCRLCLECSQPLPAANLLRQLLAEADARELGRWEDSATMGELLSMLLRTLTEADAEERKTVYARLCHTHPAMALSMASHA